MLKSSTALHITTKVTKRARPFNATQEIPSAFFGLYHSTHTDWVIYKGFPWRNSDHRRTSDGMPSGRGSFSLMHCANRSAV